MTDSDPFRLHEVVRGSPYFHGNGSTPPTLDDVDTADLYGDDEGPAQDRSPSVAGSLLGPGRPSETFTVTSCTDPPKVSVSGCTIRT